MKMIAVVTAVLLGAVGAALAAEPQVGRWAVDASRCGGAGDTHQSAALTVTPTSLRWAVESCTIGKMYKAKAVYVQAHCGSKGDVSVTLDAQGDRMKVTWNRAKTEEMRRCP